MRAGSRMHLLHVPFSRLILALVLCAGPDAMARAAEGEETPATRAGARPTLRVGVLPPDLALDGRLTEAAWTTAADSIADLTMVEPEEGGVPTRPTVVKVLADRHAIVFGVLCRDADPQKIVTFSKGRDADLSEEDHLIIVLDPYLDGRSGYVFSINAAAARFDGLVAARGEEVNKDWDTSWEARTHRDSTGWSAEIRIPISNIGFLRGATSWGFNLQRRVQRLQEVERWSGANLDYEIYQTSHAGLITDLPAFDLGYGLTVRPAFVERFRKAGPHNEVDTNEDWSLDVAQRLGPHLLSALTVNTDFSETEVDVRQINLSRFPIIFPEKRTFFLLGSDVFEFGLGLDEETLIPFYSRRIGLFGKEEEDLAAVPIDVGGKINGRLGSANVGALVVNTEDTTVPGKGVFDQDTTFHLPYTSMGAMRIKQDLFSESAVGLLGTFGDQMGREESWSTGADLTLQTSHFQDDKNLLFGTWGMLNGREFLTGDKTAYGARFEYPNDLVDGHLALTRIGDGFDPSLGFVPRKGVQIFSTGAEITARPGWPGVRLLLHELAYTQYVNRHSDRWESYDVTVKPIDWLFESGDRVEVRFEPQGDRLEKQFEVYPDIDIAPGSYEWTRNIYTLAAAAKRPISGELRYENGGYYTGTLTTRAGRLTLRPSSLLTVEFTGERNKSTVLAPENESVQLFVKSFTQDLFGLQVDVNISSDLQFSSLTQYDSESRELGSNNRIRWTFHPDGDLFLVYNHNEIRKLDKSWQYASSQAPIKVQFAWRF
jgi:uncharacterized protein DUF5916